MKPANLWVINHLDDTGNTGLDVDLETLKNFNVHANTVFMGIANNREPNLFALKQQMPAPQVIKVACISHAIVNQLENFLNNYSGKVILDGFFISHIDSLPQLVKYEYVISFIKLLPYTDIFIGNVQELEKILNVTLTTYQTIKETAQRLLKLGVKSVLIKGGQLKKGIFCQDYWCNQEDFFWIATERLSEKSIDTKNIFSSAIAACLSCDYSLKDAIIIARMYLQRGLRKTYIKKQTPQFFHGGWPDEQMDLPYLCKESLLKAPQAFKAYRTGFYPIVKNSEWVEKLLAQQVKTIQLRIKNAHPLWIEQEIRRSVLIAKKYQANLFINDYWKWAIQYDANGVHLGQEDLATADIDAIYQSGLYLGVSTHCYYEVAAAHTLNPSYIACGPIYFTQSKIMSFKTQGIQQLNYWRRLLDYPLVAIGGITLERLSGVIKSGVDGVAVISAITQANAPCTMTQKFLLKMQQKDVI